MCYPFESSLTASAYSDKIHEDTDGGCPGSRRGIVKRFVKKHTPRVSLVFAETISRTEFALGILFLVSWRIFYRRQRA